MWDAFDVRQKLNIYTQRQLLSEKPLVNSLAIYRQREQTQSRHIAPNATNTCCSAQVSVNIVELASFAHLFTKLMKREASKCSVSAHVLRT